MVCERLADCERTQVALYMSAAWQGAHRRCVGVGRTQPRTHTCPSETVPHLELLGGHTHIHQRCPEKKCLLQNNN